MKNFIKTISLFCLLVFLGLSFVGCADPKEDKFYEQTNLAFNTFITEVCKNEEYSNGLKYGENVTAILNKIKTDNEFKKPEYANDLIIYTQLTDIYDKIFVNSFKFLAEFENIFNVTNIETITGDTKKQYLDFEQSMVDVKASIENIKTEVADLDLGVHSSLISDAVSIISKDNVRKFKVKYIELSQQIIELCNQFLNLVENYVYPKYDTYKNGDGYIELTQTQLVNQRTIVILKSAVNTLTPAIKYLNDFDGDYVTLDSDKFFVTLDNYLTLDYSNETTVTVEELQNWKDIFDTYTSDTQNFYVSLEKVDLPKFKKEYNCVLEDYLEDYPKNIAYITKILTFTNTNVTTLYNSLLALCN